MWVFNIYSFDWVYDFNPMKNILFIQNIPDLQIKRKNNVYDNTSIHYTASKEINWYANTVQKHYVIIEV